MRKEGGIFSTKLCDLGQAAQLDGKGGYVTIDELEP
jgi:hypothetical protein